MKKITFLILIFLTFTSCFDSAKEEEGGGLFTPEEQIVADEPAGEDITPEDPVSPPAATPTQLVITTQPANSINGAIFSLVVEIRDANNEIVDSNAEVTLNLAVDPSNGSANLGGNLVQTATSGTVTFSDLSLNFVAAGYQIHANSPNLTAAESVSFDITNASSVTIDPPTIINIANQSSYSVTGTCSDESISVDLDLAGVSASGLCSGGLFNISNIEASSLPDGSIAITATHGDNSATGSATKDATAPVITAVVAPTDGDYVTDGALSFLVNFSENINTTDLSLSLLFDSGAASAIYSNGDGTNAISLTYTVLAADLDGNGITLNSSLSGNVADLAGNPAVLNFTPPNTAGLTLNQSVPEFEWFYENSLVSGVLDIGETNLANYQVILQVKNSGQIPASNLVVSLVSNGQGYWSLVSSECPTNLAVAATCNVTLNFKRKGKDNNASGTGQFSADDSTYNVSYPLDISATE